MSDNVRPEIKKGARPEEPNTFLGALRKLIAIPFGFPLFCASAIFTGTTVFVTKCAETVAAFFHKTPFGKTLQEIPFWKNASAVCQDVFEKSWTLFGGAPFLKAGQVLTDTVADGITTKQNPLQGEEGKLLAIPKEDVKSNLNIGATRDAGQILPVATLAGSEPVQAINVTAIADDPKPRQAMTAQIATEFSTGDAVWEKWWNSLGQLGNGVSEGTSGGGGGGPSGGGSNDPNKNKKKGKYGRWS